MAILNWNLAPKDATFFAYGLFRKVGGTWHFDKTGVSGEWKSSSRPQLHFYDADDYCELKQQWPETDERIDRIGRDRTTEDMGHYDEQREQHEQAQPAAPQANKYDRTILGKYGSGKCTVDVYRVLNAFPSGSPEIDHALKKLLAPGKRGVKDELQDLEEAIQSIEARIDYLKELGK